MTHSFPTRRSSDLIEIYLRHSRGRTLMTFHIPNSLREQFQQAIQGGTVDGRQAPIAFEAPTLEPWAGPERDHLRVRIDEIVIQYRSEEHTSELQSLIRISYAVFCL